MMNVYMQEEDVQTPAAPAEGGESTDMGGDMATPATEAPAEGGEETPAEGQTM